MDIQLATEQRQTISQRMIQSARILQMNTQELEAYIKQQEMENPLIELRDAAPEKEASDLMRKLEWLNSADEQNRIYYRDEYEEEETREPWNISAGEDNSLAEYVLAQLMPMMEDDRDEEIFYYLACSLDSRGYLEEDMEAVRERFGLTAPEAAHYLSMLQSVDPAGIGARSLSECLLLQLDRLQEDVEVARRVVLEHLKDMGQNHLPQIAKALGVSLEDVLDACEQIRGLNPKPGSGFSDRENLRYIQPDVTVIKFQDYFQVMVNDGTLPKITINDYYRRMLKGDASDETKEYISTKLNQAEWVMRCIEQRGKTLNAVTRALVERQKAFFELGPGHRVPLRLSDIAERLDVHESTVSRAVREKYLQCAWGIYPMNYFFSRSISGEQTETVTPERLRQEIRRILEQEDGVKPLSDQKIAERLAEAGIEISRRTVAKYRQEMNIPGAGGRKHFGG